MTVEELFLKDHKRLVAFASTRLENREDAEDAVLSCYELMLLREKADSELETGYAFGVVSNICRNLNRGRKGCGMSPRRWLPLVTFDEDGEGGYEGMFGSHSWQSLREDVLCLRMDVETMLVEYPGVRGRIVRLWLLDEWDVSDIAPCVGCSVAYVKSVIATWRREFVWRLRE